MKNGVVIPFRMNVPRIIESPKPKLYPESVAK